MITRFKAMLPCLLWCYHILLLLLPLYLGGADAQGLVCKTFDLPQHAGFAGDFCANRLPSSAKMCMSEKESFTIQLKSLSDKLVNQATAFWCGHQASVLCKALGSISPGSCAPNLFCGSFVASNCVEDRDCLELSATTQCCPYCQTLTDAAGCAGAKLSTPAYCSQTGCAPTKPCSSAYALRLPLSALAVVIFLAAAF